MPESETHAPILPSDKRRYLFALFIAFLMGCLTVYGAYTLWFKKEVVSTDNAYVQADVAEICAQTSGRIMHIAANDMMPVVQNALVVEIDPIDARHQMRITQFAHEQAETTYQHHHTLAKRDAFAFKAEAIPYSQLLHQNYQLAIAKQQLEIAKDRYDYAQIQLNRTKIHTPISGVVVKKSVHLGQFVQPGQRLMSVVPTDHIYVEANFKETQLSGMHVGQNAVLYSDRYGPNVKYRGVIQGIGGGTGSAFALIPAQNATGNWIKVIQRLPVRIALNVEDIQKFPLQVGLSMHVTVELTPPTSTSHVENKVDANHASS